MTETKNTKNNEVVAADIDFLPDENPADFKDDIKPVYSTGRGLTEDTVRAISAEKHEPDWMLAYRLKLMPLTANWPCLTLDRIYPTWI